MMLMALMQNRLMRVLTSRKTILIEVVVPSSSYFCLVVQKSFPSMGQIEVDQTQRNGSKAPDKETNLRLNGWLNVVHVTSRPHAITLYPGAGMSMPAASTIGMSMIVSVFDKETPVFR